MREEESLRVRTYIRLLEHKEGGEPSLKERRLFKIWVEQFDPNIFGCSY